VLPLILPFIIESLFAILEVGVSRWLQDLFVANLVKRLWLGRGGEILMDLNDSKMVVATEIIGFHFCLCLFDLI
jgi:hypothetical protein